MTEIGPWIIGISSTVAYLAAHNARKSTAQLIADANEAQNVSPSSSFLRRAAQAAGSPVGVVVTIALPIMIAEIVERCMSIAHSDKLKLIAPFVADGAWAFGSAIQTLLTSLAASNHIENNKKIIDALFLMVITEVAGLTLLATLVGHADSMNVSAPFIGRALLLTAMGCSAKVRMEIDEDAVNDNGIHGIATSTNILNKFAVLFRDTDITMMLAIKAMHESEPQKTLYRKTMEGALSIQAMDSLVTLWYSMGLPTTEWRRPAFAAFAIQALTFGLACIDATGAVGKHQVDIRPALGIISAFAYYLFKQI